MTSNGWKQTTKRTIIGVSVGLSLFLLFIYPDELSASKKRFLFWFTQVLSFFCLSLATEVVEGSIIILGLIHILPLIITSRPIQTLLFPLIFIFRLPLLLFSLVAPLPQKKMLSMDEYNRQTVVETDSNILKLVRQIRDDPIVLSSIQDPETRQRLRSWSHLSDDLVLRNYHEYVTSTIEKYQSSSSSSSSSPSSLDSE